MRISDPVGGLVAFVNQHKRNASWFIAPARRAETPEGSPYWTTDTKRGIRATGEAATVQEAQAEALMVIRRTLTSPEVSLQPPSPAPRRSS